MDATPDRTLGALSPGTEVGGYRIGSRLGSGAMGTVYRAYDGGGDAVAIKFLHPHLAGQAQGRERLRREAAALQRLRHPCVAQVFDVEVDGPEAFIVTELVDGPTLEQEIERGGPLDAEDLFELADQLAAALNAVHAADIVHRDLKPSNVLIASRGPVLIDFGIAQGSGDARVTATGLVMGTPGYLDPELLTGAPPSRASDWWGWAALLAYAATGRAPFGVHPVDAVLARASAGRPDLVGLGPITQAALGAALVADPALRMSPGRVVAELHRAAEEGDDPAAAGAVAPVDPEPETLAGLPPVVPPGTPPPLPAAYRDSHDGRTAAVSTDAAVPLDATVPPDLAQGARQVDEDDGEAQDVGYVRPQPRGRALIPVLVAIALIVFGVSFPGVMAAVVVALVVTTRTIGVATDSLHGRRERRGVSSRDRLRIGMLSPVFLVRGAVGAIPSLVLAGAAWWGCALLGRWLSARSNAIDRAGDPVVLLVLLAVAGFFAVLLAWRGPLSRLTRYGTRTAVVGILPGSAGTVFWVLAALALTAGALWPLAAGHAVSWWPIAWAWPSVR